MVLIWELQWSSVDPSCSFLIIIYLKLWENVPHRFQELTFQNKEPFSQWTGRKKKDSILWTSFSPSHSENQQLWSSLLERQNRTGSSKCALRLVFQSAQEKGWLIPGSEEAGFLKNPCLWREGSFIPWTLDPQQGDFWLTALGHLCWALQPWKKWQLLRYLCLLH